MISDWKQFELAVAALCRALAPIAKVTHDAMVADVDTSRPRQRDVWIEAPFGGHFAIRILVSCKRYARRLTAQQLDAFVGELASSGAHKGVIYSASGFTKGALEKAEKKGISCCVLLENEPPPIPDVLIFEAYYLRERFRLIAEGVNGAADWVQLLNAEGAIDGEAMPAHRALASLFAADLPALREALGPQTTPIRRCSLTLSAAGHDRPIHLSVVGDWAVYRARIEAWLINGSYSFTDGDFKGNAATPSIDTWSTEPGPGWELIGADAIAAGNTIKLYIMQGDIGLYLAEVAAGTAELPPA